MVEYIEDDDEKTQKPRKNKESATPVLDNFCVDLVKMAAEGKLEKSIGRDKEILRMARILSRRKKNNPIIIGEAGCGKTNLVEGLAMQIHQGNCPKNLISKRLLLLDLTSVVAGTKYRGQFEERMKVMIDELKRNKNTIIVIDEIHTVVGSGNASGSMDGANILKPALARGEIQIIGATTIEEYRKSIDKDKALERRFQKIQLNNPSVVETIEILKNSKDKYEAFHKVTYSDEVIELCVKLADRYIADRAFPDKAFDIMDEVGAKLQTDMQLPKSIEALKDELKNILEQKKEVISKQNYERAAELRDLEQKVLSKMETERNKFEKTMLKNKKIVVLDDVYEVVSLISNVPITKMNSQNKKELSKLGSKLKDKVIGQEEAIDTVVKSIQRHRLGIRNPNKPNVYMLIGSTGIGKTHLAKKLAELVFGSEDDMVRIDMSEYQERFTISRLIGSAPGYVDSDKGGELTEKVRSKPYCVLLLDEFEKAHPDISSLFLQIFDDGYITDSMGRKVNFKNVIVLLTSNLGAKKIKDFGQGIGFVKNTDNIEEKKKDMMMVELKKFYKPEFINRIDEVLIFNALTEDNIRDIARLELNYLKERLEEAKYLIDFDDNIVDMLVKKGYNEESGARQVKRVVEKKIENYISDEIMKDNILENVKYKIKLDEEGNFFVENDI
jgi:ATP-dependent Clp protease ATP-binding subunit ClpC